MLIIYILLGIVVLIAILGMIAPKKYTVERNKTVNASAEKVFNTLKSLKEMDKWSPWSKRDPNMTVEYGGVDGEIGSTSHWNGNKEVGEGEHEVTVLTPNTYIETELRFLKPFKSTNKGYYKLKELEENQTEIVWGMAGNSPFPMNVMMLFMNMDKMVGKDFEEGLASFKEFVE